MVRKVDKYGYTVKENGDVIDPTGRVWDKEDGWYRIGLFELTCTIEEGDKVPKYCSYGVKKPSNHCTENFCKYLSLLTIPLTYSVTNDRGYCEALTSFPDGIYDIKGSNPLTDAKLENWTKDCIESIIKIEEKYENEE